MVLEALENLAIAEDTGSTRLLNNSQAFNLLESYEEGNKSVANRYNLGSQLFSPRVPNSTPLDFVSDELAFKTYIPKLLIEMAAMIERE